MRILRQVRLRRKLARLALICSAVALCAAAAVLGWHDWWVAHTGWQRQLGTLAAITARGSVSALAAGDRTAGERLLGALEADPQLEAAALYDRKGKRLAEFKRDASDLLPDVAPNDGAESKGGRFQLAVPVRDRERVGTLLVWADPSAAGARVSAYVPVALATVAAAGLIAYLLAGRLSERFVEPVQALVAAAGQVKEQADYSVRVAKHEDDELGTLTDAFNEMLARIQQDQTELYRSSERLRLAIEAGRIGTWDWNLVRDEIRWNRRQYEIFGVEAEARINAQAFFDRVHADDRLQVKAAIEAAARNATDFAVEFRLARAEPPARYVAARGLFLKSSAEDPLRAVGVSVDISERRGAELRALESEVRFRTVAERTPALIWSCDAELRRDYFNRTWLTFTGRAPEEEAGEGWCTGVHPPDLQRWRELVRNSVAQRDPYTVEYRLRRADGVMRWVVETGSPRTQADGSFGGYLGSCIDITVRKENEAELEAHVRHRTRELEIANEEMEAFSYSVSHDLRGPVRAIQGFTEIAIEECRANNPAAALARLERIVKSTERMNVLIDAFISLGKISRAELVVDDVNLSRLAEDIVGHLRAHAPERDVETVIAPHLYGRGDERLLRVALENLLGNAWKFSQRTAQARVEFGREERAGQPAYFIRDNGVGFDPANRHKLFRAFERLHPASDFEGVGVGLSTVQRIIAKHGGDVWAEAREGEGAIFRFTLPG